MNPMLLKAASVAGLISLDFTGWGPWMLSQPLVTGPLFGYIFDRIAVGVIIGGIVQLLWLDVSPIGVGIPYDATAVTILGVYWTTLVPHPSLSQIILALIISVPLGYLFRYSDQFARRLNVKIVHQIDKVPDERLPLALNVGIAVGLVWSWARYALMYGLVMWLGQKLWGAIAYSPRMTFMDRGLTMAVILLPVAGMGVAMELFLSDEPERRWTALRNFKPKERSRS